MVRVGAQSGVAKNAPDGARLFGSPAMDANRAMRAHAVFGHLPDIKKKVKQLEKRIAELEAEKE